MKIVNEANRTKNFEALAEGSVFIADGCTFIKITEVTVYDDDDRFNAVMLTNGELACFCDFDKVEFFPDAFLTVK